MHSFVTEVHVEELPLMPAGWVGFFWWVRLIFILDLLVSLASGPPTATDPVYIEYSLSFWMLFFSLKFDLESLPSWNGGPKRVIFDFDTRFGELYGYFSHLKISPLVFLLLKLLRAAYLCLLDICSYDCWDCNPPAVY